MTVLVDARQREQLSQVEVALEVSQIRRREKEQDTKVKKRERMLQQQEQSSRRITTNGDVLQ